MSIGSHFKKHSGKSVSALIAGLVFLYLQSCITIPNQHNGFPPGIWRGLIYINEYKEEVVTEGRNKVVSRDVEFESKSKFIPFNFEIQYDSVSKPKMIIINGSERIVFDDISIGKDRRTGDDTFRINLWPYDSYIKGIFEEDKMRGHYVIQDKKDYYMIFEARYGQDYRFHKMQAPSQLKVNGMYQAVFSDTSEDRYNAIGEFIQKNQIVTGTFRTETGDYRFLEGEVSGNQLRLSAFDVGHAFLFEADINGDSLSNGVYYSGKHYKTIWRAGKISDGYLKNPDSLTSLKNPGEPFRFSFSTPDNKVIDFNDDKYRNKVKIVQIMGSWCPNCRDESEYLNEYLSKNPNEDLVIVGLAFERYSDKEKAFERVRKYKERMNLRYEIAYGGLSNKDSASIKLPQLTQILAYPTMLFIDRNNHVYKIHSGFDGPATSAFDAFKKDFEKTVQYLLDKK